jgi:hypothetical protein
MVSWRRSARLYVGTTTDTLGCDQEVLITPNLTVERAAPHAKKKAWTLRMRRPAPSATHGAQIPENSSSVPSGTSDRPRTTRTSCELPPSFVSAARNARFAVVGDDRTPLADSLRRMTPDLGFGERVRFPAFREDAAALAASFDVFVSTIAADLIE